MAKMPKSAEFYRSPSAKGLRDFLDVNSSWVADRLDVDGVLHDLPLAHVNACMDLFKTSPDFRETETELSRICYRHCAVGIYDGKLLRYPFLTQRQPRFLPHIELEEAVDEIVGAAILYGKPNNYSRRLNASVGRVISNPKFLASRDKLRAQWRSLPAETRPSLPLIASPNFPKPAVRQSTKAMRQLVEFFVAVDELCGRWDLLGLTTWHLPAVRLPQLIPTAVPAALREQGHMGVSIPWHFSVLGQDGVGATTEMFHELRAAKYHGVVDPGKWDTYAHMFELDHWERVLSSRYSRMDRVHGFVTKMEAVLADILQISTDRIGVLRKSLKALRRGSIKSLLRRQ